jgi:hypothetical protein
MGPYLFPQIAPQNSPTKAEREHPGPAMRSIPARVSRESVIEVFSFILLLFFTLKCSQSGAPDFTGVFVTPPLALLGNETVKLNG